MDVVFKLADLADTDLLEKFMREFYVCRTLGVRAMHLEVERDNAKAHAVYHKIGFEYQDSFLMTKCVGR